jgi:hypothetical protein
MYMSNGNEKEIWNEMQLCVCWGGGGVVSGLVGGSSNALPFANTGAIIES